MEWLNSNQVKIDPPKKPKKITGTRFASIFGVNTWTTPFAVWCEITKAYEKPFEDTKYTIAGKIIEPKQIEYLKKSYFMTDIKTPTDVYGKDYFNKTYGDFFSNVKILGGMWDCIRVKNSVPHCVIECKTTSRAEDWNGEIPEYYALQAALYAYLLGVDDVIMIASFLEDKDYDSPENFVPSPNNTITIVFKMSERYPNFENEYVIPAVNWWNEHIIKGVSPVFDEKDDAEILKHLRTNNLNPDSDINSLLIEADELTLKIAQHELSIKKESDRLKNLKEQIKKYALSQFREGDTIVTLKGQKYEYSLSKSTKNDIDSEKLKKDGIYEKYLTSSVSYRLTSKAIKEEK